MEEGEETVWMYSSVRGFPMPTPNIGERITAEEYVREFAVDRYPDVVYFLLPVGYDPADVDSSERV